MRIMRGRGVRRTRRPAPSPDGGSRLLRLEAITETALSYLDLDQLLDHLLDRIRDLLDADTAVMLLVEEDDDVLVPRAAKGLEAELEADIRIEIGRGFAGRVAAERRTVVIDDVDQADIVNPILREFGVKSLIGAPLLHLGQVIGVVHAGSFERSFFGQEDGLLLQLVADRVALAVTQSRLYEAERLARREAEAAHQQVSFLARASEMLTASLDYRATLERIAELAVPELADEVLVDIVADDRTIQRLASAYSDRAKVDIIRDLETRYPPASDALLGPGAVIRSGKAQVASEVTDELARRASIAIENAELRAETQERARASLVLDHIGEGVFLIDSFGVVRLWNPAAEGIIGIPADEIVGRPILEAFPGWAPIRTHVPVGGSANTELRAETFPIDLGGREVWVMISGVAFPEGTVYAFRDVTEEHGLRELQTEFVATISHELRTPLAAVYGAAMTLRDRGDDLEPTIKDRLLSVVYDEAGRLTRIIDDVLWASRIETGTLDFAIEACHPEPIAQSVLEAARAHLPRGLSLDLKAIPSLPDVATDADKVRQVLTNLLDNAVKYSPEGGRILVSIEPNGGFVRFAVTDEGLGIPAHEQSRIFEKFHRLDPRQTRGVGGTGLGLYISRELVRRMSGRIWVESEVGNGSTFFVELPIADGSVEADVLAHLG